MKVEVYGGDHSPWVNAVLQALHEKGIEHSSTQVPPLEVFKQWGVLMPAVSIDSGAIDDGAISYDEVVHYLLRRFVLLMIHATDNPHRQDVGAVTTMRLHKPQSILRRRSRQGPLDSRPTGPVWMRQ